MKLDPFQSQVRQFAEILFRMLGIRDIAYNQPSGERYPTENPWA